FGDDGGRGDREAAGVAIDQANLRQTEIERRCVNEQGVGVTRQGEDGALHRQAIGRGNADRIELVRFDARRGNGDGYLADLRDEPLPLLRREHLRVADAAEEWGEAFLIFGGEGWEDDGGGDEWTRHRA